MQLLFALYKYFPFGGLQKDMLAIAEECHRRGHQITVFTSAWQGEQPEWLTVIGEPVRGFGNHRKMSRFGQALQAHTAANHYDLVVGFNKLPGLDLYYAADSCFEYKARELRSPIYRLGGRYRHYHAQEEAVFGVASQTQVLMISKPEIAVYQRYYQTPDQRITLLPPGIRRDRIVPENYAEQRAAFRQQWQLSEQDRAVLMVGSGFRTKGVDRAIEAVAALPQTERERVKLLIVGEDKREAFERLAEQRGVTEQVIFTGGRNDVEQFLWGADLLIHPAYRENTGTVLLEAMVAGLPVLASEVCGYASYVSEWQMGEVIAEPFSQQQCNQQLAAMLNAGERAEWLQRAERFASQADIYSMTQHAVDRIEALGAES